MIHKIIDSKYIIQSWNCEDLLWFSSKLRAWFLRKKPDKILAVATNFNKAGIPEQIYSMVLYPATSDIEWRWNPGKLCSFLNILRKSEEKQESLGQCIVKTVTRPNVILPLLFWLDFECHNLFESK